ncbi:MAG TPA: hypothetical protein VGG72_03430 [Bryobacteraceae bacterium]
MTDLEKSLYVAWIGRFGKKKVLELTANQAGAKTSDRIRALIKASSQATLNALLLEGFRGYFHQTVFLRRPKQAGQTIQALLKVKSNSDDRVHVQSREVSANGDRARLLLMVTRRMDFVLAQSSSIHAVDVPFPVALDISNNALIVQVMTMQSGVFTWGKIVGQDFRRILTFVRADFFNDQVLAFIGSSGGDSGNYLDCSKRAVELMKSERVDTYGGKYEAGADGHTEHKTVRGKGKKALRESRPKDFQSLIGAARIINCELIFRSKHAGLEAGSKVALYPSIGKIAFRSNLEGCDPDGFIKAMAKP